RMRARSDVPEEFRRRYDEAIEFRFRPDYAPYVVAEPARWMERLRLDLEPLHLACETKRLGGTPLRWSDYPERALSGPLRDGLRSPWTLAQKARNCLRPMARVSGQSLRGRLALRAAGMRGVLPVIFPIVAYDLVEPALRTLARDVLRAPSDDASALRRAYLEQWGVHGDPSFP